LYYTRCVSSKSTHDAKNKWTTTTVTTQRKNATSKKYNKMQIVPAKGSSQLTKMQQELQQPQTNFKTLFSMPYVI
ncbi:hypothetical protein, partial [Salmonella sp. s29873]|uniref:hypothetical protein n=1 Tax=Salmonella sp. s29873 TaxID=3159634 RepID=UPI0039812E22